MFMCVHRGLRAICLSDEHHCGADWDKKKKVIYLFKNEKMNSPDLNGNINT